MFIDSDKCFTNLVGFDLNMEVSSLAILLKS